MTALLLAAAITLSGLLQRQRFGAILSLSRESQALCLPPKSRVLRIACAPSTRATGKP